MHDHPTPTSAPARTQVPDRLIDALRGKLTGSQGALAD
jgi:hypothetical protein